MDGEDRELDVVTGAFSFTGQAIARRLLERGRRVRTLTGHPDRPDPFGGRVEVQPFAFDDPPALARALGGASTLYNTYWVRFPRGPVTYEKAVENTRALFRAAREAGVRRVVHVSIANPDESSPLPYYRWKAVLEKDLAATGLSRAVVRPTVIFGPGDVLINNIAWLVRKFPLFGVPGRGDYPIQPIFVEDMADLCVEAAGRTADETFDAAGPETFTFEELVRTIAAALGRRVRIFHSSPGRALFFSKIVGLRVGDVVLTPEEVRGLMAGLLGSKEPPRGRTPLGAWLRENAARAGTRWASEVARHYR